MNPEDVKDVINDFLEEDLVQRGSVETVVLSGSFATGKATKRSDIDLCYIGFSGLQRESINFQGHEFQLMIAPWSWYDRWAVKTKYQIEELKAHDPMMASHLSKCISSLGSTEELQNICLYVLEPVGGWMKESWKS
ncbi:nucleotidyltransferase domain-containing protein [Paenibacillus sp. ISL-20]|uniref:nucleotidyltransferase family protein n=1 Tax=Paenibacillus sp. ISL-20 TaxID=2819163 RepID=UPI001BE79577|nr:nucleotidyltransferase domain-containing protein [Paenibacillus sp. ISL-20]MBT2763357.1 nucleotidyltransferase domain-containing protein [Paenibacillus sp. ISL-20]